MRTTRILTGLLIAAGMALVGGLAPPIGVDAAHVDSGHALARRHAAGPHAARPAAWRRRAPIIRRDP
jgi:hypothetical protein